jgi:hypothetical protein
LVNFPGIKGFRGGAAKSRTPDYCRPSFSLSDIGGIFLGEAAVLVLIVDHYDHNFNRFSGTATIGQAVAVTVCRISYFIVANSQENEIGQVVVVVVAVAAIDIFSLSLDL